MQFCAAWGFFFQGGETRVQVVTNEELLQRTGQPSITAI
jgi:hypothetical protein